MSHPDEQVAECLNPSHIVNCNGYSPECQDTGNDMITEDSNNSAEPEKSGSHNSVAADNETATNRVGEVDFVCEVKNCPHHTQGNDLAASDRNANTALDESAISPPNTGDIDIDTILEGLYRWTVSAVNPEIVGTGEAPLLKPSEANAAITKKLNEARLDEAKKLRFYWENGSDTYGLLLKRIAELQATKEN